MILTPSTVLRLSVVCLVCVLLLFEGGGGGGGGGEEGVSVSTRICDTLAIALFLFLN